jgi:broad specificity phosphatase PhoE
MNSKSMNPNRKSLLIAALVLLAPTALDGFLLAPRSTPNRPTVFALFEKTSATTTIPVDAASVEEARNMQPLIVSEMPDPIPETLKNNYYFLRHGLSTANVAEVISSDRSLAYSDKHGLTAVGYEQGKQSATQLLDVLESKGAKSGDKVRFVSSPFARAKQTAEACLDGLMADDDGNRQRAETMGLDISTDVVMENRLMERYFGRLDNEAIYTYSYVWPLDKFNVTHTAFDVESVAAVCTRLREVVKRCESEYEGHHLVWVSHADVLQIGQLYAANAENVGDFSSFRFKNGEVRAMKRTTESLPDPVPLEAPTRGTNMQK